MAISNNITELDINSYIEALLTSGQEGKVVLRSDGKEIITLDDDGHAIVTLGKKIAGEDLTNDIIKTRTVMQAQAVIAADTALKSSAGFLHAITFSCNDAAPTAGSIIFFDNTAESGTQIFNHTFTTTPFTPITILVNQPFATGLYAGFTTTADVNVTPSFI